MKVGFFSAHSCVARTSLPCALPLAYRREAALTRTAKSLCAGPTTSPNLDSHMGEWKSCCVPDDVPDDVRYARNKFFNHSQYFLWAPPSWKSLAIGSNFMGKITSQNIINICSSYRPWPMRRNMKIHFGQGDTNRSTADWLVPGTPLLFPWTSQAFLSVSGSTLSSLRQGAPSVEDLRCLTVVSRGIREPSGVEDGTQSGPRDFCTVAQPCSYVYLLSGSLQRIHLCETGRS